MEVFLVAAEDLAVYGHLVRCGVHFTSSSHQYRALHLHFKPTDVPLHHYHEENARDHLRSVVLRAYHDCHQTSDREKVSKGLPDGCFLAVLCYACLGYELRILYDIQSFSYASQENSV